MTVDELKYLAEGLGDRFDNCMVVISEEPDSGHEELVFDICAQLLNAIEELQ